MNPRSWSLPLEFDGVSKDTLMAQQQEEFPTKWQAAGVHDKQDYGIEGAVLFSTKRPGPRQAQYTNILLVTTWQDAVVDQCHIQTGHAEEVKTSPKQKDDTLINH